MPSKNHPRNAVLAALAAFLAAALLLAASPGLSAADMGWRYIEDRSRSRKLLDPSGKAKECE